MGLRQLRQKAAERQPPAVSRREIVVEGETLLFRDMETRDLYPHVKRVQRLVKDFPRLADQQRLYVLIFGATYFLTEQERLENVIPDLMFAEIARDHAETWLALLSAHKAAFPGAWRLLVGDLSETEPEDFDGQDGQDGQDEEAGAATDTPFETPAAPSTSTASPPSDG